MKFLIDIALIITLLSGGSFGASKIYFKIKKTVLPEISKGLPPLSPFTKKLTGIEIPEFSNKKN